MMSKRVQAQGQLCLFGCFEPTMKQRNIMNAKELITLWLELGINDTRLSRCKKELNSSSVVLKRTDVVEDFLDKIAIGFYLFIRKLVLETKSFTKASLEHFEKLLALPGTTDEWLWKRETHPYWHTDTHTRAHTLLHASKSKLAVHLHLAHTAHMQEKTL